MKRNTDIRWCQAADCEISGTANWRRVKRTNEMAGVLPIDWPVSCSDGFSFSKLVPHQFDSSGRAGGEEKKNKTRGGVCKVRPRTFIAWWVLPAGRGTSLLHRKSNATPGATPGCRTSVCGPAAECLRLNIAAAFPRVNDSHVCPQLRIRFYLNRPLRLFPYSPGSSVWVGFYRGKEI